MATARVCTDMTELTGMVPYWQRLVDTTTNATVFQTPEWALAWLGSRRDRGSPFGLALVQEKRLVGFAPFCLDNVWGARVLRFMGGDLNDFNCLVAEPSYRPLLYTAVAETLAKHSEMWDVLSLTGLSDDDSLVQQLQVRLPTSVRVSKLQRSDLPTLTLPDAWETYYSGLTHNRRKSLEYAQRRLSAFGKVTFRVLTDPEQLASELPVFFEARMENWRARKRLKKMVAVQRTSAYWSTLTKICLDLAAQERVWLGRLDVDGVPASWDLAFATNGSVVDYMTTYNLRYAHASPGQLVMRDLIRYAIEQGKHYFVLGRGAQPYKYWFGARTRTTQHPLIFANRPRGRAYAAIQVIRERALDMAKTVRERAQKYR